MVVYVDDLLRLETRQRPHGRVLEGYWSQLLADDTVQLLTFADGLGLRRGWIQHAGTSTEHFDVTADVRDRALGEGAVAVTTVEAGHLVQAKRAGIAFDLGLLRGTPDRVRRPPPPSRIGASWNQMGGPRRVRLTRAPESTLPRNTVAVAPPSRWANPYRLSGHTPAAYQAAVDRFAEYLARNPALVDQARGELAGHDLGCWCPLHLPCHADLWLNILSAN